LEKYGSRRHAAPQASRIHGCVLLSVKNERKKKSEKMQQRRRSWDEVNAKDGDERTADGDEKTADGDERTADGDESMEAATETGDAWIDGDTMVNNNSDKEGNSDADEVRANGAGPPPPPPWWDEATLVERARAEGLLEYKTFEEVPEQFQRKVRKTVFPPTREEADRFGLEKCLRCLPHDMDTGGFFVALLRKVAPMSARAKKEAMELAREFQTDAEEANPAMTDFMDGLDDNVNSSNVARKDNEEESGGVDGTDAVDADLDADSPSADTAEVDNRDMVSQSERKQQDAKRPFKGNPRRQQKGQGDVESFIALDDSIWEPIVDFQQKGQGDDESFIALDDSIWEPIVDFYGLSDTFPRDQYMARACGEAKALYFVGAPIKNLMNHGIQDRLKVINTGLKGFG
jgi:hypothetical protein